MYILWDFHVQLEHGVDCKGEKESSWKVDPPMVVSCWMSRNFDAEAGVAHRSRTEGPSMTQTGDWVTTS